LAFEWRFRSLEFTITITITRERTQKDVGICRPQLFV